MQVKRNGMKKERAGHGNVHTNAVQQSLDMKPGELSKHLSTNISKESGCEKKNEDVPEEVTLAKKFTLKKLSKIFHNIERPKQTMLEADLKSEKTMKICQRTEKMHTSYHGI